jgi:GT2 family glycosyltransferase
MATSTKQPVVVIPNLNAGKELLLAVGSLQAQTLKPRIVIVDNASSDDSIANVMAAHPEIDIILHDTNKGYAGGVNPGFRLAIESGADYVAPFNDDAVADKDWLKHLVSVLDKNPGVGAVNPKVYHGNGDILDSTGDTYSHWGLSYPRGRGEKDTGQYDRQTEIFAASGAASLYRVSALTEVGLLDEDFFAYYEDIDLSFRLQLAGWTIRYEPQAIVHHQIGMTSARIKGFTTYQTMKNQPLLLYKNVPRRYLWRVGRRFWLAHWLFFGRAITRGQGRAALRGDAGATWLLLKKWPERRRIQAMKKVSDEYIWGIMSHDLPPNANALRKLRTIYWKLTFRKTI